MRSMWASQYFVPSQRRHTPSRGVAGEAAGATSGLACADAIEVFGLNRRRLLLIRPTKVFVVQTS